MNEPTVDNVNHPTHYKPSFRTWTKLSGIWKTGFCTTPT